MFKNILMLARQPRRAQGLIKGNSEHDCSRNRRDSSPTESTGTVNHNQEAV